VAEAAAGERVELERVELERVELEPAGEGVRLRILQRCALSPLNA